MYRFELRGRSNARAMSLCGGGLPLLLFAFLTLFVTAAPRVVQAAPDVCTVQANNPRSLTIQQAVDSGCSRILVTPGTYHENVVIPAGNTVAITGVAGASRTIVDGSDAGSVFTVNNGANVTLTGLTIQNGSAGEGGGIFNSYGAVTLINSTVTGNTAFDGGGIFTYGGTITLTNSTVMGNTAYIRGGGGIFNIYGTVTLTDSTVTGNTADLAGGGIFNRFGTLTLTDSTVTGNTAYFLGGGIYSDGGTLTLTNSPVTGNTPDDIL
jgi:predicted outer membrane repeat protein